MSELFGYDLGQEVPSLETEMPLLKDLVDDCKASQPLRGVTALLIQHQLGNQGPQVDALMRLGLDPRKTIWLDIPYTSSAPFRRAVGERHHIPAKNFRVSTYRILEPYGSYQFRRTQEILAILLRNPPDKLLVLDD